MRLVFTPHGWSDHLYWQATDRATVRRINRLLEATLREPLAGIGKPEQLRHVLQGCWSRRIDEEHRLVYLVDRDDVVVLQARYHYQDAG
ncbi:MAG: Txe/YoeB family addiction module toxin [Candidatus Dormibacteria bacterium]